MSQSCFSLGFLSQYSLWKLSTFRGYKGYLYQSENEMRRVRFFKTELTGDLTELRVQATSKQNCQTGIFALQCSSWRDCSSSLHASLVCIIQQLASSEFQSQVLVILHNLEHFFTLSHILPLHDSHLNTRLLIAKLQANLAQNKANKMVD